ncbi:MAG: hypothetical protein ACFE0I_06815 [Elainellaceae cyanobacterium]
MAESAHRWIGAIATMVAAGGNRDMQGGESVLRYAETSPYNKDLGNQFSTRNH